MLVCYIRFGNPPVARRDRKLPVRDHKLPIETASCLLGPQEDSTPYVSVMLNQVCMNTGPPVPP